MTGHGDHPSGASPGEDRLGGVVLCRVGEHRLAFPARQVVAIEQWAAGGREVAQARAAFALPVCDGRLLLGEAGDGVVVDTLEIASDPPAVLPTPGLLGGQAGGALRGFLAIGGQLWPLLRLPEFSRYLGGTR